MKVMQKLLRTLMQQLLSPRFFLDSGSSIGHFCEISAQFDLHSLKYKFFYLKSQNGRPRPALANYGALISRAS
jgi:hypothetical protein